MKKLLTLLGAVGLITIATTTVVACGNREKGKLVNITEFEKKVIFEAQGRHQTIDQAKEAIAIISDLPEGIESINVTTVNNNIKVVFIAQDGYQTPNPLIIKFIKNNKQENKITKELVDAELTKLLVKEKTYETDELAIAAIQAIETDAFKVKEASKLTKAFEQHTFNVIVEAKSGYVLAEGIEEGQTTIELSIGKA
ncbi:lipoprotein, partial [Mesoplasma seiffertii]|uniref:lipoprotein n=1 Tax=Mesoplasma seiffertii TaxID=28224 RepID=UPI00055FD87D